MTEKKDQQQKTVEIAAIGFVQIVSAIAASIPAIGSLGAVALSTWQLEQQRKFAEQVELRFRSLDQTKLDQAALESDWFKELLIRVVEEASKTASELKRQALASVLANSAAAPSNLIFNKMALFRILSQMSDEEMVVFTTIQEACTQNPFHTCQIETIARLIEWNYKDTRAVCESLTQLNLLSFSEDTALSISEAGRRLIAWWSGAEFSEKLKSFRSAFKKDTKQEVLNTLGDILSQAERIQRYRH